MPQRIGKVLIKLD